MRFLIQRVNGAAVTVDGETIGEINQGLLVLMGVTHGDTKEIADKMIGKLLGLRIFSDENGKTNLDLASIGGEILLVSQFTLYADCSRGNRPGFTDAGDASTAEALYEYAIEKCEEAGVKVETGVFGAHMKVSLTNDGPFTIMLDSENLK